jgi:hypothetical protein
VAAASVEDDLEKLASWPADGHFPEIRALVLHDTVVAMERDALPCELDRVGSTRAVKFGESALNEHAREE